MSLWNVIRRASVELYVLRCHKSVVYSFLQPVIFVQRLLTCLFLKIMSCLM